MKRSAAVRRDSLDSRRPQSHTELCFSRRELAQPRLSTNRFDASMVERRRAQPDNVVGQAGPPVAALLPSNHTCSANQAKQRPEAMLCLTRALLTRDSSEQCPPRLRTTARSASKVSADRHTSAQCHRPSSMHAPEHTPGACSVQILPHALLNTGIEYPQPVEYNVYASQYASRLSQATKRFMTCTHHAWLPTHTASI